MGLRAGIENLSSEDLAWARGIGAFGAWKKALREAVRENRGPRVAFILRNRRLSRSQHFEMVTLAVDSDAGEALGHLLAQRGFDFTDSGARDRSVVEGLIDKALARRCLPVWRALAQRAEREPSTDYDAGFMVTRAGRAGWREAVGAHLDSAPAASDFFKLAVQAVRDLRAEDLAFVLSWSQKFMGYGPVLSAALPAVVKEGDAEKARLLLEHGADPNTEAGTCLFHAIAAGHRETFDLLLEYGGDLAQYGRDVQARLREVAPKAPLMDYLAAKVAEKTATAQAAAEEENRQQRYHLVAPDSFCETLRLPGGRTLTTVFNFSTRQQVTIAGQAIDAQPAIALTVRDFAEIADPAVIEAAYQRLRALGGMPPAAEESAALPKKTGLRAPGSQNG